MSNSIDHKIRELLEDLDATLGSGSMGTVYASKKRPSEAIKEIRLDTLRESAKSALAERLRIFQYTNHPCILEYNWALQANGFVYISMKRYYETLTSMITRHKRERKPIPEDTILRIINHIVSALAYLHDPNKQGKDGRPLPTLLHQNLKTDNILTNKDATSFVVADFGLCLSVLESRPTFTGVPTYSAPEVRLHNMYSTASDMWSLGIIIYELATLSRPNLTRDCKPADVFVDGWKPDLSNVTNYFLKEVIERLLVLNPRYRISAKDLMSFLSHQALRNSRNSVINVSRVRPPNVDPTRAVRTPEKKCVSQEVSPTIPQLKKEQQTIQTRPATSVTSSHCSQNTTPKAESQSQSGTSTNLAYVETPLQSVGSVVYDDPIEPTRMILAACRNDVEGVRTLLSLSTEIGKRDARGMTALMHAALRGHKEIVHILARKEAGLKDEMGMTALMHAALNGHVSSVSILVKREKGMTDKRGRLALKMALENNQMAAVKCLIKHEKDHLKWTDLMCAAAKGDITSAKKHLDSKSKKDATGDTALIIAAKAGYGNIVDLIKPISKKGVTPLMHAAKSGDINTVRALAPSQGGMQTTDCYTYDFESKSHSCSKGYTALMLAARHGNIDVINELIKHEVRMQTENGETALMQAVRAGQIEAVKLLADHEKGMKATSNNCLFPSNYTALAIAITEGNQDIVKILSRYPEERR